MTSILPFIPRPLLLVLLILVGFFVGRCSAPDFSGTAPSAHPNPSASPTLWTCSMHPSVQAPKVGDCPICGMDLIPLEIGSVDSQIPQNSLLLASGQKALAGIRTVPVLRTEATHDLSLVGKLVVQETSLATLSAWVSGRLDRLHVDFTGQTVRQGDPLAEIYSPELFPAQEEWILAHAAVQRLPDSPDPSLRKMAGATVLAAAKKLELLGVSEIQMEEILARGVPTERLTLFAPLGGTVLQRHAVVGQYVQEGDALFTIANLEHLWLEMDAYESDLPWLQLGQDVLFEVEAWPGESFSGKISFLDPVLDALSRTVRVRVEVANPSGRLRPHMFVRARVQAPILDSKGELPLLIPASSPLLTGKRALVFVELPGQEQNGASIFQAREVVLGPRAGEMFVVQKGLEEGDRVVMRGAFTLDSEFQLQGKQSMMAPQGPMSAAPPTFLRAVGEVLLVAASLGESLAADDWSASQKKALAVSESLALIPEEEAVPAAAALLNPMRAAALAASRAEDIAAMRLEFRALQIPLIQLVTHFGFLGLDREMAVFHCPMAFGEGADWVDFHGDAVRNPYYGASMLACGKEVRTLVGLDPQPTK